MHLNASTSQQVRFGPYTYTKLHFPTRSTPSFSLMKDLQNTRNPLFKVRAVEVKTVTRGALMTSSRFQGASWPGVAGHLTRRGLFH